MAKTKSYFFCKECGYQSSSWLGRCPECGAWNSFTEEVVQVEQKTGLKKKTSNTLSQPKLIQLVSYSENQRQSTHCGELDRVLGGGIVPGSLVLIGGEPGIGKSTLLLQTALLIKDRNVLYVSGEESEQQIRMRAERIGISSESCYVVSETNTQRIMEHAAAVQPDLLIVDSIQTLNSESIDASAGSVSQIRECTAEFQRFAKESGVPVFIVGHITKDGNLAGPKLMEHIVDCVLQFEGDRNYGFRILRALKNRFGSTAEIGIFEMHGSGLKEVSNPSEFLLSNRDEQLSGTSICVTLEGARPMMIEVQSLVSSAVYGTPQRNSNGFDYRRLSMLLAVLEKRCGFKLGLKDVFLNIAGGLRISDPAMDLAVVCSILSSNVDMAISQRFCFAGELGLTGEVRPVSRFEQRVAEADRLGYERIICSKYNLRGMNLDRYSIHVTGVGVIEEAFRTLFAKQDLA
ncbi:MAG: DNA repair protein RadA [Bacteroidales bacterium]|nr:DNA repair protein RadA [Bacteroidales bacterium]